MSVQCRSDESGSDDGFVLVSPPSEEIGGLSGASRDGPHLPVPVSASGQSIVHAPSVDPTLAPPPMMRGATDFTLVEQSLDKLIAEHQIGTDVSSPPAEESLSIAESDRSPMPDVWEEAEDEDETFEDDDEDTGFDAYEDDVVLSQRGLGQRSRQAQKSSARRPTKVHRSGNTASLETRTADAPAGQPQRRPTSSVCCLAKTDKKPYTLADVTNHLASTSAPAVSATRTRDRPAPPRCPVASSGQSIAQPQMNQLPALQSAFHDHWRSVIASNFDNASRGLRLKSVSPIDHSRGPHIAPIFTQHALASGDILIPDRVTTQYPPHIRWAQLLLRMLNDPAGSGPAHTRIDLVYLRPPSCMHSDDGTQERFRCAHREVSYWHKASGMHGVDECQRHCQWPLVPASPETPFTTAVYTPELAHHLTTDEGAKKQQFYVRDQEGVPTQAGHTVLACAMLRGYVSFYEPGPEPHTTANLPRHLTCVNHRHNLILLPLLEILYDDVDVSDVSASAHESRAQSKRAVKLDRIKLQKTAHRSLAAARQEVDHRRGTVDHWTDEMRHADRIDFMELERREMERRRAVEAGLAKEMACEHEDPAATEQDEAAA